MKLFSELERSHEPWTASLGVQETAECVLGIHYPKRIIDLEVVAKKNANAMVELRNSLISDGVTNTDHCRPSNDDEIRQFFWLSNE